MDHDYQETLHMMHEQITGRGHVEERTADQIQAVVQANCTVEIA